MCRRCSFPVLAMVVLLSSACGDEKPDLGDTGPGFPGETGDSGDSGGGSADSADTGSEDLGELHGSYQVWGFSVWSIPPENGADSMALTGSWAFSGQQVSGQWDNHWTVSADGEVLASCSNPGQGTYDPTDAGNGVMGTVSVAITEGECTGEPGPSQGDWHQAIAAELGTFQLVPWDQVPSDWSLSDGSRVVDFAGVLQDLGMEVTHLVLVQAPSFMYPDSDVAPSSFFGLFYLE